ncbi:MAG: glucose-6-phosphate isomerase [Gemmatimonadota bacterium]|nr:glucose-6-phosphate isomerase [Gemmatimonadota bacterium]
MTGSFLPARVSLGAVEADVVKRLAEMDASHVVQRIWEKDPSVWGGDAKTLELSDRLGWLGLTEDAASSVKGWQAWAKQIAAEFERVVLCGMGGSSLAPEVLARVVGGAAGYPEFVMLDSTAPSAVSAVDRAGTLFIISSKSGSTLETMSFFAYLWESERGRGERFVAITDPGTSLERLAKESKFRYVVNAPRDVGGRFSALTPFGLLPATLVGVDVEKVVGSGSQMETMCKSFEAAANPGAWLGAVIGQAALAGRDKLTMVLSPALRAFGLWVEQLVAESTGKQGKGILPVVEWEVGELKEYGEDRVFVSVRLADEENGATDDALDRLEQDGHPVVRYILPDRFSIGAEFFRWEFATAVAGHILGVNPFDQPNVQEAKVLAGEFLAGDKTTDLQYSDSVAVREFLQRVSGGDYVALQVYVAPDANLDERLNEIQSRVRKKYGIVLTWGYGPRYLHSTGQLHKGGPPRGWFVQVVDEIDRGPTLAGEDYGFGNILKAQADGDCQALSDRGLPVVRVDSLDIVAEALVLP